MNTFIWSGRASQAKPDAGRRGAAADGLEAALLGVRGVDVEAPLDAPEAVGEQPAHEADLGGDEDRRRHLGPVPLPAVQVDEDVGARRDHRADDPRMPILRAFMTALRS